MTTPAERLREFLERHTVFDDDKIVTSGHCFSDLTYGDLRALAQTAPAEVVGYLTPSLMDQLKRGLCGVMTVSNTQNAHFSEPIFSTPTQAEEREARKTAIEDCIAQIDIDFYHPELAASLRMALRALLDKEGEADGS